MTIAEATKTLKDVGITTAELDALVLAEFASGKDRAHLLAHPDRDLGSKLEDLVKQRAKRTPIAHLTGKKEFYGLEFIVSADVLSPRPESEKMVEWAIKYAPKNSSLLDVGTGCGALAIAIQKHRPDLKITATEISDEAIDIAKQNFSKHSVDIELITSDVLDSVKGKFSTVIANLPYLKDDEKLTPEVTKEPGVALFGGPDGLNLYRKFFKQLPDHLEKPGFVFIESDPWQQPDLIKIAHQSAGLAKIEQDYFVLGLKQV